MKQDLTQYSDDELSLVVMNDEYFYNESQKYHKAPFFAMIEEFFIYTKAQFDVLLEDLEEEDE